MIKIPPGGREVLDNVSPVTCLEGLKQAVRERIDLPEGRTSLLVSASITLPWPEERLCA